MGSFSLVLLMLYLNSFWALLANMGSTYILLGFFFGTTWVLFDLGSVQNIQNPKTCTVFIDQNPNAQVGDFQARLEWSTCWRLVGTGAWPGSRRPGHSDFGLFGDAETVTM